MNKKLLILEESEIKEILEKDKPTDTQILKVIQNYLYQKTKDKIYIRNPITYTSDTLMFKALNKAREYFNKKYKIN